MTIAFDPVPPPLGVSLLYNDALASLLAAEGAHVDAVSLIPEMLWDVSGAESAPSLNWIPPALARFKSSLANRPLVFHGIGLSPASAVPLDLEHLDRLVAASEELQPRWFSEHLAAFRTSHQSGQIIHAGVALSIPFDRETLRLVTTNVELMASRLGLPILLENSAIYVPVGDSEMSEATFLNRVCSMTGAGVLLDLHNLVTNEINHGWSCEAYLEELALENVREIHVAGGEMLGRWYTDAHAGPCPDKVWALLEQMIASVPNIGAVTFEVHESRVPLMGPHRILLELARIRDIFSATHKYVA